MLPNTISALYGILSNTWTHIFIILTIILRIITSKQRETASLYYKKTSELMKRFVNETNIKDLYYTPYTFAFNGHF
jgi:hypothetical protein